jgi:hypothetical protein
MKARGDPSYNTAFANATAGKKLNSYRTAKKSKTVTNTTARNNSAALKTAKKSKSKGTNSVFSTQANLRGSNIPNTGAMNAKVDSIVSMAADISAQVNELMRFAKTLKSGRAPNTIVKNTTAKKPRASKKTAQAANSLLGLPPLPVAASAEETATAQENASAQGNVGAQENASAQSSFEAPAPFGAVEPPAGVNAFTPVQEVNENANSNSAESSNSNAFTPPQ